MTPEHLLEIGSVVRSLVQHQTLNNAFGARIGSPGDLGGACSYASWAMWKAVPGSRLVLGVWGLGNLGHCWVEYKARIIDLTATQFGHYPKVLITPKSSRTARSYYPNNYDALAEQETRDWHHPGWRNELYDLLVEEGLVL